MMESANRMPRFMRLGKGFLKLVVSGALLVVLVTQLEIDGTLAVVSQARGVGCFAAWGLFILGLLVRS